ncbi:hypothetical protein N9J24_01300 [Bacteroidia bacterium]|nr:hypothetical protein [Bacteroidia bacterium]
MAKLVHFCSTLKEEPLNLKAIIKKNSIPTFIGAYVLFLWLFPNQNQSGDSYGYAFSMESGNYLTSPHHLLYNWLGYGIAQIFPGKAMLFMLKINGLLMGLSLLILNYILTKSTDKRFAFALTIFCASCFASLRFASLNETYVIPLFFSLLGSWFLLKNAHSWKNLLLGFGFMVLAVLFHQIHIFWLLSWGIIYAIQSRSAFISFLLSGFIILAIYLAFASNTPLSLWHYITQDVQNGLVTTSIGPEHFIFTGINSIRTLVQVHGNVFLLLNIYPVLWFLPLLLLSSIILFIRFRKSTKHVWILDSGLRKSAILAFILHFLWVIYSMGNAEFMLLLPFLGVIAFGKHLRFSAKSWTLLAVGMGIWNIGFHVIPKNILNDHRNEETRSWLLNKDAKYFVAHDRTEFTNYMDWKNTCEGEEKSMEIWDYSKDYTLIHREHHSSIYTNMFKYPKTFNRRAVHELSITKEMNPAYEISDSLKTWRGSIFLGKLK